MKSLFSILCLIFCSIFFTHAQSKGNLTVFSETGEKFYLLLDGVKQNDIAHAKIRIQDLPDLYYSAKIIFTDPALPPILKNNVYVSDGEDIMRDASYRIRSDNGKAKLNFFSMVPVRQNYMPPAGTYVYQFGQAAPSEIIPVAEKKPAPSGSGGGSLTIFSNNEKFYLFLDGIKQNEIAQSKIRIRNLPDIYYNVKIVFKAPGIWPIVKNNLYVSNGDDILMDASYRIRKDKAGRVKLNFFSIAPVQQSLVAEPGIYVYDFNHAPSDSTDATEKAPAPEIAKSHVGLPEISVAKKDIPEIPVFKTMPETNPREMLTASKIEEVKVDSANDNPKPALSKTVIPVKPIKRSSVPDIGNLNSIVKKDISKVSISKSVPARPGGKVMGSSSVNANPALKNDMPVAKVSTTVPLKKPDQKLNDEAKKNMAVETIPEPARPEITSEKSSSVEVEKVNAVKSGMIAEEETAVDDKKNSENNKPALKKCNGWPMGISDLADAKQKINDEKKEELKLLVAKVITAHNCLLASQVTELCGLFKSEKIKLEFVLYAYSYTSDRQNYADVYKAFSSDESRQAFIKFVNENH